MQNYDEPMYLISVVAKILNIHPQTLRQYERERAEPIIMAAFILIPKIS